MERPSDVLPTPGGPTKHRIGPFGFRFRTAVSIIRSDLFEAVRSSFNTFSALAKSSYQPKNVTNGKSVTISIQLRNVAVQRHPGACALL
jgi:hypothetical protein